MNLGYMSKPYETGTSLYDYGFRDYRPVAARFTTVDPIRDGNNWFAYVNNDPVNYVDLWGLCKGDVRKEITKDSKILILNDKSNQFGQNMIDGLRTEPARIEQPLPSDLIQRFEQDGWVDISRNQEARNEAARVLIERTRDPDTKDYWAVITTPTREEYYGTRPRTQEEGGGSLPNIVEWRFYDGYRYEVYPHDPETGSIPSRLIREYLDLNGDRRIDLRR